MESSNLSKEYSKGITNVINFILKNLAEDLPLNKLAAIANYSPFHFQKIFKQVIGESPKQYIIRLRLETAAHFLVIHHYKSITEVALESGFTSPAIFARAFKNYFGISAQALRCIPMKERLKLYKKGNNQKQLLDVDMHFSAVKIPSKEKSLKIEVQKITTTYLIAVTTTLTEAAIQLAFKKVIQLAEANDLLTKNARFIGIIYPHQNLYKASVTVENNHRTIKGIHPAEITAGKFATFRTKGDLRSTFKVLNSFTEKWLPDSNYRMADIFGFEVLSQKPVNKSYHKIEKQIFVPVEPDR